MKVRESLHNNNNNNNNNLLIGMATGRVFSGTRPAPPLMGRG